MHITRPTEIDLELAPEPESVSEARHSLERLRSTLSPERFEKVALLASELVTNSLRYAGLGPEEHIRFTVMTPAEYIRVEVEDSGPGFDFPTGGSLPSPEQVGGRGLYLMQTLSDWCGVEQNDLVVVWFEIDR